MVPSIGDVVSAKDTATSRAVLPFLSPERQIELLGGKPDRQLLSVFAKTQARGYAISEGEVNPAATTLASAIFDFDGQPMGAVAISGPRDRLGKAVHKTMAESLVRTALELSRNARS
jgi:IclR family acetate operon transcriptional repressor